MEKHQALYLALVAEACKVEDHKVLDESLEEVASSFCLLGLLKEEDRRYRRFLSLLVGASVQVASLLLLEVDAYTS